MGPAGGSDRNSRGWFLFRWPSRRRRSGRRPICWCAAARPQGFERARLAKTIEYEIAANWKIVLGEQPRVLPLQGEPSAIRQIELRHVRGPELNAGVEQRMAIAVAQSESEWKERGIGIAHTQAGLAQFPDAENDLWYSATRTVLVEGYESESMDGRRVAPR